MRHHFNYKSFPGVDYTTLSDANEEEKKYQTACIDVVKDLEDTLKEFQVKIAAAYARLRIEKGAIGDNALEQMNNILPEEVRAKEEMAGNLFDSE